MHCGEAGQNAYYGAADAWFPGIHAVGVGPRLSLTWQGLPALGALGGMLHGLPEAALAEGVPCSSVGTDVSSIAPC